MPKKNVFFWRNHSAWSVYSSCTRKYVYPVGSYRVSMLRLRPVFAIYSDPSKKTMWAKCICKKKWWKEDMPSMSIMYKGKQAEVRVTVLMLSIVSYRGYKVISFFNSVWHLQKVADLFDFLNGSEQRWCGVFQKVFDENKPSLWFCLSLTF